MNDLTSIAPSAATGTDTYLQKSQKAAQSTGKTDTDTTHAEKVSHSKDAAKADHTAEKPRPVVEHDHIKLSFTSQAKLLKLQGQSTQQIAQSLGVTQQQVQQALASAETVTAALISLQATKG